mgnify:CR=1 FL=1
MSGYTSIDDDLAAAGIGQPESVTIPPEEPDEDFDYQVVDEPPDGGAQLPDDNLATEHQDDTAVIASPRQGLTRAQRRARARNARDSNIAENLLLRQRLAQLEAQLNGVAPRVAELEHDRVRSRLDSFDARIAEQQSLVDRATTEFSEAMLSQDSTAIAHALASRDAAVAEIARLGAHKQTLEAGLADLSANEPQRPAPRQQAPVQQPQAPQGQPQMSAEAQAQINQFMAENQWVATATPEQKVALARLDAEVTASGLRPESDEYWDALETLMRASPILGKIVGAAPAAPPAPAPRAPAPRRGPPLAGGGDRAAPASPARTKQVHLTAGRKDALQRLGVLAADGKTILDSVRFKGYLKQYNDWDRQNGGTP